MSELFAAPMGSPAFERAIRAIDGLGEREVAATTQIAARFQDRPVRAVEAMLADRAPFTRHLRDLRETADELVRQAAEDQSDGEDLVRRAAEVEDRVRRLVGALDSDRQVLEVDNAALDQQERALWISLETLRTSASLAARLDELVGERIDGIARTDPAAARALQLEVLHPIRRRRRDLLLQLAVATQGYAALRTVEQDNLEVIWGIRAATTTTVTALRTALLAARVARERSGGARPLDSDVVADLRDTLGRMQAALDDVDGRRIRTLGEARHRPTS